MNINSKNFDFTVLVPASERFGLAATFFIFCGGFLWFLRYGESTPKLAPTVANFFFAIGLFGVVRLVRYALEQKTKGVRLDQNTIEVDTLLYKKKILYEDLPSPFVLQTSSSSSSSNTLILNFRGQKIRISCENIKTLSDTLKSSGLHVVIAKQEECPPKDHLTSKETDSRASIFQITGKIILPTVLWLTGAIGLILVS